jgi:CRP-like cAMP-binding protein
VREVEPRRDLIREGDEPRHVHLLLDGWACRYKSLPDGRRQVLAFMLPGALEDSRVFLLRRMDHSIGAITRLRCAEIPPAELEALAAQSPTLARALWRNDLVNAAIAREWVLNVGQRTAHERLAHIMCEVYFRLESVDLAENGSCDWPLTQNDLAEAAGLTSVHVNRTLQLLRGAALIDIRGRRLTILDLPRLKEAGLFTPNYLHFEQPGAQAA